MNRIAGGEPPDTVQFAIAAFFITELLAPLRWCIESGGTPGVTYVEYNQPDDSYTTHMSLYRRGVVYEECRSPAYAMGRLPSMASIRLITSLQEIAGQL